MDHVHLILGMAGLVLLLAALGSVADSWERRDARRRNGRR